MPNLPRGAQLFGLRPHTKHPYGGTRGHLDAIPASEFEVVGNYGIALDGQWLLVDVDRPEDPIAAEWADKLPETWMQKTPRGTHRLYRMPPGTYASTKNNKFPAGDLKVKGYLVGPGSEVDGKKYYTLDEREPVMAPQWLQDMVSKDRPTTTLVGSTLVLNEREIIPIGENDTELFIMATFWRRHGFTESAIRKLIAGVLASGVVEQVPGNEYSEKDIARLAHSAAKYDPELGLTFTDEDWISAEEISLVGPPYEWWIRGFIPKGELVTLYGRGGIGKSSWASWLAAIVTKRGGRFVFVGVEEPFARFAARAVLGGADRTKLFSVPEAYKFALPRDVERLKEQVVLMGADIIYFDSVYSHFESVPGENAAERARKALAPLANLAITTGCTVIAVFHENKAGQYLGSVEMQNVARYALAAKRTVGPLRVWVEKQNIIDPGFAMQFNAEEVDFHDPETGQIQLERLESGELVPMKMKVLTRGADTHPYDELDDGTDEVGDRDRQILRILENEPDRSANSIQEQVGGRRVEVLERVKVLKQLVPE